MTIDAQTSRTFWNRVWPPRRIHYIVLGGILALIAVVIATFMLVDQLTRVAVPDVSGQAPAAAAKTMTAAGLVSEPDQDKSDGVCSVEPPSSDYCEATGQSVASETRVRPGSTVTIVFKVATVTIPDLVGLSYDDAVDRAEKAHLEVRPDNNAIANVDGYRSWKVLSQSRQAGDQMDAGMNVEVTLDAPLVDVPQVAGMQFGAAIDALEAVGLNATFSSVPGGTREPSLLARATEPAAGAEQVTIGADVTLRWGYKVPDVVGQSVGGAASMLKDAGFTVDGSTFGSDLVASQDPAAGTIADPAGSVKLTLTPPTVVYEVVSDGSRATITWIPPGTYNISQATNVRLPWKMTFENEEDYNNFNAQIMNGSTVTCNIYVNGELRNTNTSTGRYSVVSCG